MVKCVICNRNEATQKHHISYIPDRTIDVCVDCHKIIHQPGVRSGDDQIKIITDSHEGFKIPLQEAQLWLKYRCNNCRENTIILYPLINFLINGKLSEPTMCAECRRAGFQLIFEESGVWGRTVIHGTDDLNKIKS